MAAKSKSTGAARAVMVHGIGDARAALAAAAALGVPVRLVSAPGAGAYGGAAWFAEILAQAGAESPKARFDGVLDCGDQAGAALAALRHGVRLIRFTGHRAARTRLIALAGKHGARLIAGALPALDLAGAADPGAACRDWLSVAKKR